MNRLLALVTLRGALREPLRVVATILVAALGSILLLAGSSAISVAQRQTDVRGSWLPAKSGRTSSGLWWSESSEYFNGRPISVARVASAHSELTPPGVTRVPGPGELVVSPAVAQLMAKSPTLRERYPGKIVARLTPGSLEGPRTRRIVIGATPAQIRDREGIVVASFAGGARDVSVPTTVRAGAPFMVVGFAWPLVWLYVVLSSLGAATRDQRLAALRLIGARKSLLRRALAIESGIVAFIGTGVGALAFLILPKMVGAAVPVADGVWAADVTVPSQAWPVVLLGIPLVLSVATLFGARRSLADPLATSRATAAKSRHPRIGWAVLLLGITCALACAFWPDPDAIDLRLGLFVLGFMLATTGLLVAAGDLLRYVSVRMAPRSRGLAGLLGWRTIQHQGRRSVSVAAGVALLVMLAGPLVSFFPLLSESGAADKHEAAMLLGRDTVMIDASGRQSFEELMRAPEVGGIGAIRVSASGVSQTAEFACGNLRINLPSARGTGCPAPVRARVNVTLTASTRLGPFRYVDSADRWWTSSSSAKDGALIPTTLIVQKASRVDTERFRNVLLRYSRGSTVLTLDEVANEASRTSQPFRIATLAIVGLATLVAIASLSLALMSQVALRHRSTYHLRVNGASTSALWRSTLLQAVAVIIPLVVLSTAMATLFAATFLSLNGGGVPIPLVPLLSIGFLSSLVGPSAALLTKRAVVRSAQTPPITT